MHLADLIDHRSVFGRWDRLALMSGGFQPSGLGDLDFLKCLLGRFTECRAVLKIRNIGNIPAIFITVENVDVVGYSVRASTHPTCYLPSSSSKIPGVGSFRTCTTSNNTPSMIVRMGTSCSIDIPPV